MFSIIIRFATERALRVWEYLHRTGRNSSMRYLLTVFTLCIVIVPLSSCSCNVSGDPSSVARELVDAFVAADAARAKAVTTPERWDEIEEWMKERQPILCLEGEWDTTGTGGSGYHDTANNEWTFGFGYQCASQSTPHCLTVKSILVKNAEDGWKVYDWGKICEASELGYKCAELCYILEDDS